MKKNNNLLKTIRRQSWIPGKEIGVTCTTLMQPGEQYSIINNLRFVQQVQHSEARLVDQLADRLIVEEVNLNPVNALRYIQVLLVFEYAFNVVLK